MCHKYLFIPIKSYSVQMTSKILKLCQIDFEKKKKTVIMGSLLYSLLKP